MLVKVIEASFSHDWLKIIVSSAGSGHSLANIIDQKMYAPDNSCKFCLWDKTSENNTSQFFYLF